MKLHSSFEKVFISTKELNSSMLSLVRNSEYFEISFLSIIFPNLLSTLSSLCGVKQDMNNCLALFTSSEYLGTLLTFLDLLISSKFSFFFFYYMFEPKPSVITLLYGFITIPSQRLSSIFAIFELKIVS